MEKENKITDGMNDRPRNDTIGQSGEGLPDDSGTPLEIDDREVERVRAKLTGNANRHASQDPTG